MKQYYGGEDIIKMMTSLYNVADYLFEVLRSKKR